MTISRLRSSILFLIVVIVVSCNFNEIEVGNKAPNIKGTLLDSSLFNMSDLSGNYVLIDFWASWCSPCLRERASLVELNHTLLNKTFSNNAKFYTVSVALEKTEGQSKKVSIQTGMFWQYQIEEVSPFVLLSKIASVYNVTSIPSKFLIDPSGNLVLINPSIRELSEYMSSTIN